MKCEKCGSIMNLQEGVVYTSNPPMYGYTCPSCGNIQYSLNRELKETVDIQERLSEFSTEDLKNEINGKTHIKGVIIRNDQWPEPDYDETKATQNTWKPSDEQMKALHDLNLTGDISYAGQGQVLIELYNDLKKLK